MAKTEQYCLLFLLLYPLGKCVLCPENFKKLLAKRHMIYFINYSNLISNMFLENSSFQFLFM